jgi:pyruvate dehydrogenase E1 component beta subunit
MAIKPGNYAVLEAVRGEMLRDPHLTMLYEYQRPTAVSPSGQVIDLYKEFGPVRIPNWGPLDEEWFVGGAMGMAMTGVRSIAHLPSMTTLRTFELVFNQIGKLRHMTGGQVGMPMVLWQDAAGLNAGSAGQHADAGQEAQYAAIPGTTVVVPSDPYDIKGLMIAALRYPDPVIFFHYGASNRIEIDVPDEDYVVEIGKAAVRQEGTDITIVGVAPATHQMTLAIPGLREAGISAEIIDLRTVKPLDTATLFASVRKTGRMLAVDHGHQTLGLPAELIAQVAMNVPGAKVGRITFPDAPPPGARELITWMTPDAPKIIDAAKKIVAA